MAGVFDRLPSFGFVAILATYLGLAGFFVWGFREPPLGRVWELHHELKIGKVGKLAPKDHEVLMQALSRHPELPLALMEMGPIDLISAHDDGWLETSEATVLQAASCPPCNMLLDVKIPADALPLSVRLFGGDFDEKRSVAQQGLLEMTLPRGSDLPRLYTLVVKPAAAVSDIETLGVRVRFRCQSGESSKHD